MAELSTRCPNCDRRLKLPGPQAIGKKAKCPGCKQAIIVPPPDGAKRPKEGIAPPAKSSAASPGSSPDPPWGLEARWVPDPQPAAAVPAASEQPSDFDFTAAPTSAGPQSADDRETTPIAELAARRRRQKRIQRALTGLVAVSLIGGAAAFLLTREPENAQPTAAAPAEPTPVATQPVAAVAIASPTRGEPIAPILMPDGVSILVNAHPASVWESGLANSLPAATRDALGGWITDQTGYGPTAIDRLLVGFVLGGRGSEPQIAAVVTLRQPFELGAFLQRIGGQSEVIGDGQRLVTVGERVVIVKDERTFAFGPAAFAEEMESTLDRPNANVNAALVELVPRSDSSRLVTVLAAKNDLSIHGNRLLGEHGAALTTAAIETLAADFRGVLLSLHQGRDSYVELVGDPANASTASLAEKSLSEAWNALPQRLMDRLRGTRPYGPARELVGRVPAIAEAARLCSRIETTGRAVRLQVSLPPTAMANILVGTVVSYNALQADPAAVPPPVVIAATDESFSDRLNRPVEARFERLPLQEVLRFLGEEAGGTIEIEGNAFKDAGYTKNEAQTFDLGTVPIREVLAELARRYDKAAFVLDEQAASVLVTTKKFAEREGQTPMAF